MESTDQGRRRSERIANNTLIQQAITEENRLFLRTPHPLKKDAGGTLQIFSTKLVKDLFWVGNGSRLYKVTRSEYLVFDRGAHGGEVPEEEDPAPEPRAITLYEYLGVIYRRKQTGELAVEEDIRIVTWDESWLEEEIEIPIQWKNHRRHHIERLEEEESEGEEDDPRIINVRLFNGYHNCYRTHEEVDSSDEGEDVDGEGGEEGEEEEEEEEDEYEEEEENKENAQNN